jgi:hypothetical protein
MNECMDYVFDMLHEHRQEIQQGKTLGAVSSRLLPAKLAIIGKDDVVYASDVYLKAGNKNMPAEGRSICCHATLAK